MDTVIYYFSATGNCMTTANLLAKELGGAEVIPIASLRKLSKIKNTAKRLGFVFPVYYGDMPYPVREAISKMTFQEDSYIFILNTYRGHAGDVAKRTDALLRTRGQKLNFATGIPMPGNSFINEASVDEQYLAEQKENLKNAAVAIIGAENGDYYTSDVLPLTPVSYPNNFRGIEAEPDKCVGCGICAKVCSMDNIVIEDGKAVIGDDCATCLACFHWCPQEAIWMSKQENIARRAKYRHPDVDLGDIVKEKSV